METNNKNKYSKTFTQPSRTKSEFEGSTNINKIMARVNRGGELPLPTRVGQFMDVSHGMDFHTIMNTVATVQAHFQRIPSDIRQRFHNSPGELLNFLNDTKNRDEAINLGLIDKPAGSPSPAVSASVKVDEQSEQKKDGKDKRNG